MTEETIWSRINSAFATPVDSNDPQLEYVPTQYLAECFREQRFDGLLYGSALSEGGKNYMLFRLADAGVEDREVVAVTCVAYEHRTWSHRETPSAGTAGASESRLCYAQEKRSRRLTQGPARDASWDEGSSEGVDLFAGVPKCLAYGAFANRVRARDRYIQTKEIRAFLDWVEGNASQRVFELPSRTRLWRAQTGCREVVRRGISTIAGLPIMSTSLKPFTKKRMRPDPAFVRGGRGNPFGIAYLYLADSVGTAIAEVRPWVGAHLSVAEFRAKRKLAIVDLTTTREILPLASVASLAPDAEQVNQFLWEQINSAFAAPVEPNTAELDYLPTQYLAEFFREKGYAGVRYVSTLNQGGVNYMLFDVENACFRNCELHQVTGVAYEHHQESLHLKARTRRTTKRPDGQR